MFSMRPAAAADQDAIVSLIRDRSAWMRRRGMNGWDGWASNAGTLAEQAADPAFPVWVLAAEDGRVAGCTSLFEESPPWLWTEAECADASIFLATTVTDPAFAGQRLGCLIVWSILDFAACTGRRWVRRHATEPGLVRYYRDVQGWHEVRTVDKNGFTVTGMARRAEPQPDLPVRMLAPAG